MLLTVLLHGQVVWLRIGSWLWGFGFFWVFWVDWLDSCVRLVLGNFIEGDFSDIGFFFRNARILFALFASQHEHARGTFSYILHAYEIARVKYKIIHVRALQYS